MNKQQGAALAIGLILLVIITLMGYAGMKGTILQEKMAAGLHNRNLANSGANSAIRQGEFFLYNLVEVTNGVNVRGTPTGEFNDLYTLLLDPDDPNSAKNPVLEDFFRRNWNSTDGTEHEYDFTGLTGNAGLKQRPQYLIHEVVYGNETNDSGDAEAPAKAGSQNKQRSFMVTGKSQSGDGNTISLAQSMFTVVTGSDATN
ncbi:PilX N-terminal domain-containing pilus assembly protein [Marinicella sp. X102]|nr:PilX N-terminal domain-containing pilus assembly protein [Marinicella marina]